ncbi:MAG: type II secretion system protein [Verrucomicrobia bacterium]|nr:type II secretion system protein [Verrucomicrobiota bacterium]MDA1006789.1 type II secretion system protein [Verrucomicrobiota bacterium]
MKSTIPTPRPAGFTLIELLVVIAIIAVLAALGFGAGATAINNAKKLTAQNECASLVLAVNGYFGEYSHFPEIDSGGGNDDLDAKTDSDVMNILLALGEEGEKKNPKRVKYYQGKAARGSNGREYGGLLRTGTNAELFDTWKKLSGIRHYQVMWDSNYDDELADPFNNDKPLYSTVIAWSTGKDGKETRGDEGSTNNRDNVYSWK